MIFSYKLVELRKKKRLTQSEMAEELGIARTTYSSYEQGRRMPDADIQNKIANFFGVSLDYLHGRDEKKYYELNDRDERDIAKELESMISDLSNNGLLFSKDSSEVDKETRELLIASLENSLRIAKIEAKKKFTPKKYRD